MVAERAITLPCAVTTLSTLMIVIAAKHASTIEPMIQLMPRATRGMGALTIAVDGDWYSRITGSVGSPRSATVVLIAVEEVRGKRGMTGTLSIHVAILLSPKLTIYGAALKQCFVGGDIHHLTLIEYHDLIAVDQRRKPMGDDDHGPAARDAQQVGVDQRLAFRVERAGRLVQDQDARIGNQGPGNRQALLLPT